MSKGFSKPCTFPGCTSLTQGTRCDAHPYPERYRAPDVRESAAARGYDSQWRKVRDLHLASEPLCRMCAKEGRTTSGELVDHIQPLMLGGDRLGTHNLQTLCRRCHALKTASENAAGRARRLRRGEG